MKHTVLVICLLFLLPTAVTAQFTKGNWEMGSSCFAGRSWLYNYNDWHGPPMIILSDTVPGDDIFPVSPNPVIKPNSISAGFYVGYYWGKRHGLEAQINYSSVRQMFIYEKFQWGGNTRTEDLQLHYITLPISYTLTSNNRYNFQGFAGVGIEPGFLVSYKGEWFSYFDNWPDERVQKSIYRNNFMHVRFLDEETTYTSKIDFIYRRFYLGVTANAGFKSYITDNLGFSFMVRGSTSLINPENHDARSYYNPNSNFWFWTKDYMRYGHGSTDGPPKDRAHTYALRVGAELRLFYHLHKNEYTRRLKGR